MDISSLLSQSSATRKPSPQSSQPPSQTRNTAPAGESTCVTRPRGKPALHARSRSGQERYKTPLGEDGPDPPRGRHFNDALQRRPSQSLLSPADLSMTSPGTGRPYLRQNNARLSEAKSDERGLSQSVAYRPASASAMDTLAEIAYMQQQHHHKSLQINSGHVKDVNIYGAHRAKSAGYTIDTLPTTIMGSPDEDIHSGPPLTSTKSLSDEETKLVGELTHYLADNPYAFQYHVQLINLLHTGFVRHVESSPPDSYELLTMLRRARESMNFRVSLGEDLLLDWVKDECLLARSVEEKVQVVELCLKGLEDEPCSSMLWKYYGEWIYSLWSASQESDRSVSDGWSAEDKLLGREYFKWENVMQTWQEAVNATEWQINCSHLVWDRYIEILIEDYNQSQSLKKLQDIRNLFLGRLAQPHATCDDTFQHFSTFMSNYGNPRDYEETMMEATHISQQAKQDYALRQGFETIIRQSTDANDKDAEWVAFAEYLDWEMRVESVYSLHLVIALYERALLRFSNEAELWEDYVDFLIEKDNSDFPVMPVSKLGARHCPWSGGLWSKYIRELDSAGKDFREIHNVKHTATQTGLLDAGGMEELLKVCVSWCGFLLRKASAHDANEDDPDIAEVGIRSALEHVKQIGQKRYSSSFRGDPMYRLERIYIKFLTRNGNIDGAREYWRSLSEQHADSYEFWWHYYMWEMSLIDSSLYIGGEPTGGATSHQFATEVLRQGLARAQTVDRPAKLIDLFRNHCEQHESVQELRIAEVEARKASKVVAKREQQEKADAAAAAAAVVTAPAENITAVSAEQTGASATEEFSPSGKRKRGVEDMSCGEGQAKKYKSEEEYVSADMTGDGSAKLKRNREQTTILVKRLPSETQERRIRHFFRDCGTIIDIKLLPSDDKGFRSATVEFEVPEDAIFAQSKETKKFDGNSIQIAPGAFSTLFVTNFPPQADEDFIRSLFSQYGEIIDVRFPSLKYNTHRRFCYVQLADAQQAQKALELNGKLLQGNLALVVDISDPNRKKDRSGATYEGREVYVGNLDWGVKDEELREAFEQYGTVENVRIPRNVSGKSKGVGFVTFATKEEAEAAVKGQHLKEFHNRILQLSIAVPKNAKRMATTVVHSASPAPSGGSVETPEQANGTSQDDDNLSTKTPDPSGQPSSSTPIPTSHAVSSSAETRRERTLALLNVPETVNDARIRALVEPHGALRKIILRPDHHGAIIEFEHVQDVGKAALALEGRELVPGKPPIGVGSVEEMLRGAKSKYGGGSTSFAEKQKGKARLKSGKGGPGSSGGALMAQSALINRPGKMPFGGRRGGRGGLGQKRGDVVAKRDDGAGASGAEDRAGESESMDAGVSGSAGAGKSNADFRALLSKGSSAKKE